MRRRTFIGVILAALAHLGSVAIAPSIAQTSGASRKPKPPTGRDSGGIAVALIGAGVDYRLPEIAQRLARDGEGEIIGYDAIDNDHRPFERPAIDGRRLPEAAGTTTAALFLREASAARLVAVRAPEAQSLGFAASMAFVTRTPARIVAVLLRDTGPDPSMQFRDIERHAPRLLVITSAAHAGEIAAPVPANLLVVTACDGVGRSLPALAARAALADVAIPALGPSTDALASAFEQVAVVRAAALAARIEAVAPGLSAAALKARILGLAKPQPADGAGGVAASRSGWIEGVDRVHRPE